MPTTYTGNAAATQAPSDPPGSGTAPKETLPIDGEAVDAASVAQAFKVLADYAAREVAPFPAAGTPPQLPIKAFMDARLRKRFMVNHWGVPSGAWSRQVETWEGINGITFGQAGPYNAQQGRWNIRLDAAGASTNVRLPGQVANENASNNARAINLNLNPGAAGYSEIRIDPSCVTSCFGSLSYVEASWESFPRTIVNTRWAAGFTIPGVFVNGLTDGVWFELPDAVGPTWHAKTASAGAPTDVNTLAAGGAGTSHHFRIVIVGSGVGDDSAAHAYFFVDGGAPKADVATTLPAGQPLVFFFGGQSSVATANQRLIMGPVEFLQLTREGPSVP